MLYSCETWSLRSREERRLRLFENRVLWRVFENEERRRYPQFKSEKYGQHFSKTPSHFINKVIVSSRTDEEEEIGHGIY